MDKRRKKLRNVYWLGWRPHDQFFRQKIIVSVLVQDKTPCDQDRFWIEDKLDCNPR